ncbi:SRPBCC domain-containing protein [Psychromicrobium sp. YIM B11713]|uniref:SRPBCC family protein n=1 Tax=Psychromicrobium sp. YIM B11713 TaxID=3145233 RepID=UPI00374F7985
MSRKFEVHAETPIEGTPEQVWDAVTTGNSGWLWPVEMEPKLGGTGPWGAVVTAWEPPTHYANHMEGEGGFYNTLDYQIEERSDGKTWVRYMHAGIFLQDMDDSAWANQYDGVLKHTEFYQHTLAEYVEHFAGQQAEYADVQGPASSATAGSFTLLQRAIGASEASVGEAVSFTVPGKGEVSGVLDYSTEHFAGIRTEQALYRFFGRDAFGSVVGLAIHQFKGETAEASWQDWLNSLYPTSD